jgi:hypothetical protein
MPNYLSNMNNLPGQRGSYNYLAYPEAFGPIAGQLMSRFSQQNQQQPNSVEKWYNLRFRDAMNRKAFAGGDTTMADEMGNFKPQYIDPNSALSNNPQGAYTPEDTFNFKSIQLFNERNRMAPLSASGNPATGGVK